MNLLDIIEAQELEEVGLSYFGANEFNGLPDNMCLISASTPKHGVFRFKAYVGVDIGYAKNFIKDFIRKEIQSAHIRFNGNLVEIK